MPKYTFSRIATQKAEGTYVFRIRCELIFASDPQTHSKWNGGDPMDAIMSEQVCEPPRLPRCVSSGMLGLLRSECLRGHRRTRHAWCMLCCTCICSVYRACYVCCACVYRRCVVCRRDERTLFFIQDPSQSLWTMYWPSKPILMRWVLYVVSWKSRLMLGMTSLSPMTRGPRQCLRSMLCKTSRSRTLRSRRT